MSRLGFEKQNLAFDDAALTLEAPAPADEAADDRHNIQPGDFVLLIVENDLAFASFLLDAARAKGFKGLVTSLGAGALTLAAEFKPSAITLDMDGFEVARQLRTRPESRDALLIALTGYGEAESRLKSQSAGFDHHVVKPADIDYLLSIVSQAPAVRNWPDDAQGVAPSSGTAASAISPAGSAPH